MKGTHETAHRDVLRLMQARDWRAADAAYRRLTAQYPNFAAGWFAASHIGTALRSPATALEAIDRAISVEPANINYLKRRAQCLMSVRRFLGDLEGAETDYDRVIALRPLDYEAYLNRSDLRVQTAARNHVRELRALAAGNIANWLGEVQIRFALAKEYEDLGEYPQSFDQLRIGSNKRREHWHAR